MAGLLSVSLPERTKTPKLPTQVGLLKPSGEPGLPSISSTSARTGQAPVAPLDASRFDTFNRRGDETQNTFDRETGAPMDPMAYEGSLLGRDAQADLARQGAEASYAGIGEGEAGKGLLKTGTRDFAGERMNDVRSAGIISQYAPNVSSALADGVAERDKEFISDLERRIYRDEPIFRAKAQARAVKNFVQSENIRFKNWTLRQQQKQQRLQLEQALAGEKDALLGTILGGVGMAVGAVGGFIVGGPAGAAAGAAGGGALGSAAGKAL